MGAAENIAGVDGVDVEALPKTFHRSSDRVQVEKRELERADTVPTERGVVDRARPVVEAGEEGKDGDRGCRNSEIAASHGAPMSAGADGAFLHKTTTLLPKR